MEPKHHKVKDAWFGKISRRFSVGHAMMKGQYDTNIQYQVQNGGGNIHGKETKNRLVSYSKKCIQTVVIYLTTTFIVRNSSIKKAHCCIETKFKNMNCFVHVWHEKTPFSQKK